MAFFFPVPALPKLRVHQRHSKKKKKRHLDITRLNTISPAEHMGKSTSISMLFVDLGKLYHACVNLIQFSPSDSSSHGNTEAHTLVDQECWKTTRRSCFPPVMKRIAFCHGLEQAAAHRGLILYSMAIYHGGLHFAWWNRAGFGSLLFIRCSGF